MEQQTEQTPATHDPLRALRAFSELPHSQRTAGRARDMGLVRLYDGDGELDMVPGIARTGTGSSAAVLWWAPMWAAYLARALCPVNGAMRHRKRTAAALRHALTRDPAWCSALDAMLALLPRDAPRTTPALEAWELRWGSIDTVAAGAFTGGAP